MLLCATNRFRRRALESSKQSADPHHELATHYMVAELLVTTSGSEAVRHSSGGRPRVPEHDLVFGYLIQDSGKDFFLNFANRERFYKFVLVPSGTH